MEVVEIDKERTDILNLDTHSFDLILNTLRIKDKVSRWLSLSDYLKHINALDINLGNGCGHDCSHCFNGDIIPGPDMKLNDLKIFLDRYLPLLPNIKKIYFTGGELTDKKSFPLFMEELLKRGINCIQLVSRGSISTDMIELLRSLTALKAKYKDFKLDIAISIDNFSKYFSTNKESYVSNLVELVLLQFNVFGNKSINLKSTVPSGDPANSRSQICCAHELARYISSEIKEKGFTLKESYSDNDSSYYEFEKYGREFIFNITFQNLVWHSEKSKSIEGGREKLSTYDLCVQTYDHELSTLYVNPDFNISFCSWPVHHKGGKFPSLGNYITQNPKQTLERIFFLKSRFFSLLSEKDIIEHVLNPRGDKLCSNFYSNLATDNSPTI